MKSFPLKNRVKSTLKPHKSASILDPLKDSNRGKLPPESPHLFHPLSQEQRTAITQIFRRLTNLEVVLEEEIAPGRPPDVYIESPMLENRVKSSLIERRAKYAAALNLYCGR